MAQPINNPQDQEEITFTNLEQKVQEHFAGITAAVRSGDPKVWAAMYKRRDALQKYTGTHNWSILRIEQEDDPRFVLVFNGIGEHGADEEPEVIARWEEWKAQRDPAIRADLADD